LTQDSGCPWPLWTQDLPITLDIHHEIVAELGDQPAERLIVRIAQVLDGVHLRYLDIWTSKAACERFTEQRLHPVVGSAIAGSPTLAWGEPIA
jgi:hypothetical protein